jgi:ABC-2 type transport system permease protein
LPGWSGDAVLGGLALVAASGGMTILLATPFGAAASVGRGYLPATGVMLLAVFLAQVIATAGWGAYFPWSVPALYSGAAGKPLPLRVASVALVLVTGLGGLAATLCWWRYADHT